MLAWCLLLATLVPLHAPELDSGRVCLLVETESAGDPNAVSPVGAQGLAQITGPAVLDALSVCPHLGWNPIELDMFDPETNLVISLCYLRWLEARTNNWCETLAGYNGGLRQVYRLRRKLPLARETQRYLQRQGCDPGRRK